MLPRATFDDEIDLRTLRARTSEKWAKYPDDVLPAFVAETDFPIAPGIAAALRRAIDNGDLGYASPRGLGEAYAAFASARYGCRIDPASVHPLPEVMIGVAEILRVITEPGDGIVVNPPVYPPFFATIAEVGRSIVEVALDTTGSLPQLDLAGLERAFSDGARVYLFCNPHNPVGRVFSRGDVERVAALAARYDVAVLADEIHAPLVLPGAEHVAFESVTARADLHSITVTSASKGWNIPGLKCALAIGGSPWARHVLDRLPKAMVERTGHLGVHATIAAFTSEIGFLDRVIEHLDTQRGRLARLLSDSGLGSIRYEPPQAGFLAWLDCRALDLGPDPAKIFLERGKVALVRGLDFGRQGSGFARLNFATSTSVLTEIVRRLRRAVSG
ncbi:MAG TPA: aminotransferase class I/II-fold pyridoxal phosphate-dependent enzyme [Candidatus Eremiobacteraceae bacterium]|nr:aminotransferase class I/II-fold pyridoxal phosphate-dependent enzyme [Candidatus Eremiobacteraceae bacterium]